ncbi:hypothetical protein [Nitrososphaera sp.]|uniref:hypothetical protein n=1 Tax=Nitrososphaera sp. TaxID=1971748 RepID=UPI002ED9BB86
MSQLRKGGVGQDPGGAAGNIIQILANLPDFLRRPMLQKRLKEFFDMGEQERQDTIALALSAAPTIEPAKLSVLVKTWLEVLAGFEASQRTAIFSTYCKQILLQPESLQKLNFQTLTAMFLSLGERERQILADSFKEVLFSLPKRERLLAQIPEQSKKALGLV